MTEILAAPGISANKLAVIWDRIKNERATPSVHSPGNFPASGRENLCRPNHPFLVFPGAGGFLGPLPSSDFPWDVLASGIPEFRPSPGPPDRIAEKLPRGNSFSPDPVGRHLSLCWEDSVTASTISFHVVKERV